MSFHHVFCEPREGFVAHSVASRKLDEEPLLGDGLWLTGEIIWTATPKTIEAMENWQDQEPEHTAIALQTGREVSAYKYLEEIPGYAPRFGRAMTSFVRYSNYAATIPRLNFVSTAVFEALGKATVVDIGGTRETDAIVLAQKYPGLDLIVQDMPRMVANAEAALPEPLRNRIKFMAYDFFTPQTVVADTYLIKQCFHNWPDHYCVRIFKNQITVMKPGSKIIVLDGLVLPPGTMSVLTERKCRAFDMMMKMMTLGNGRKREAENWKQLSKEADKRFKVTNRYSIASPIDFEPASGVIEVVREDQSPSVVQANQWPRTLSEKIVV